MNKFDPGQITHDAITGCPELWRERDADERAAWFDSEKQIATGLGLPALEAIESGAVALGDLFRDGTGHWNWYDVDGDNLRGVWTPENSLAVCIEKLLAAKAGRAPTLHVCATQAEASQSQLSNLQS